MFNPDRALRSIALRTVEPACKVGIRAGATLRETASLKNGRMDMLWHSEINSGALGIPGFAARPRTILTAWRTRLYQLRHHKILFAFFLLVAVLPMALSPSHPVAVYGYLAHRMPSVLGERDGVNCGPELTAFLISRPQVARYKEEILQDLMDPRSGRMFAVVRRPDGSLAHEQIRTWNAFLPSRMPVALEKWSDRKEFTFLGDEVALWLDGKHILALGHYHPFGGGPSPGDGLAQGASACAEVVVSNGLIPIVYLDGNLATYGEIAQITPEVFRGMRAINRSLMMDISDRTTVERAPGVQLSSFLAYLREYRGVDTHDLEQIGDEVSSLCEAFKVDYGPGFPQGFSSERYTTDPDRMCVLTNLRNAHFWSLAVGSGRPDQWRSFLEGRSLHGWIPAAPSQSLAPSGRQGAVEEDGRPFENCE